MDKSITIVHQSARSNHTDSAYVPGTEDERMSMVWPITCEVVSLSKKFNVEQRLQRHIINIVRKKS